MFLPLSAKHIIGPLIIIIAACVVHFMFPSLAQQWLVYDRFALQGFETWRLISGSLVHTNTNHLMLNVAAIVLLWAIHGHYYQPFTFVKLFIFCSVIGNVCLYYLSPNLIWYVGLSGPLHGIFIWGCLVDIRQKEKTGWLLLAGVAIKLGYEQIYGPSADMRDLIDANVAVDAHLYGAIAGLLAYALSSLSRPVVTSSNTK